MLCSDRPLRTGSLILGILSDVMLTGSGGGGSLPEAYWISTTLGLLRFGGHPEMGQEMRMNKKRAFSDALKTEAVRRVQEDGKKPASVAKELGLGKNGRQLLHGWLKMAEGLTGERRRDVLDVDDRAELERLRRENERLKLEREILKKAAAFFASESR